MKIGIITLNGIHNIGNRLQNYAVQELLKERGHEASTILYSFSDDNEGSIAKLKTMLFNMIQATGFLTSKFYLRYIKKSPRMLLFQQFNDRYISFTSAYYYKTKCMERYYHDFDYFCAGSDQVWTTALVQNRDFFFMQFAPTEKTFSFSASMGTTFIPEKYQETYQKGFSHVGNISVRETDLQDLIFQMTGRNTTLLLDPTMLCDKQTWLSIACKPAIELPKRYIATYFLSAMTDSQRKHIQDYAVVNGLEVIDIMGKHAEHIGPAEFVYILANADFIFTDSFHGTAFSIIFDKNFIVFQRNNIYDMSSRITTVLKTFQLSNHFYNSDNNTIDDTLYSLIDDIKSEDRSQIQLILHAEKEKMNAFLDSVFRSK